MDLAAVQSTVAVAKTAAVAAVAESTIAESTVAQSVAIAQTSAVAIASVAAVAAVQSSTIASIESTVVAEQVSLSSLQILLLLLGGKDGSHDQGESKENLPNTLRKLKFSAF